MQSFTISLPDEFSEWVELEADSRGVSKAKVIRDAVEEERTELVNSDDTNSVKSGEVLSRIAELEQRVDALEGASSEARESASIKDSHEMRDSLREPGESSQDGADGRDDDEDIVEDFRQYLEGRPPQTEHGKAAVVEVFRLLRERGPMKTSDLRESVFEQHSEGYSSAQSMWQSIQRYFDELPGIEKGGYGEWIYSGDEVVHDELRS